MPQNFGVDGWHNLLVYSWVFNKALPNYYVQCLLALNNSRHFKWKEIHKALFKPEGNVSILPLGNLMIRSEYFYFSRHCLGDNFHFLSSNNVFHVCMEFYCFIIQCLNRLKSNTVGWSFPNSFLIWEGSDQREHEKEGLEPWLGLASKHWASFTKDLGMAALKPSVFKKIMMTMLMWWWRWWWWWWWTIIIINNHNW